VVAGVSATVAQSPYGVQPPAPKVTSKGLTAVQHAAAADKYLFVFFWKERNQQTDALWAVLQSAMSKVADRAERAAVNVSDPTEKAMVAQFGLDRSPMPLVLALAPNGAITKGFPSKFNEDQLMQAFVSPGTASCLKALQARKLVLLVIQRRSPSIRQVSLQQGVADFAADARFAEATEIVAIDPADPAEASFLRDLPVDPRANTSVTVLLAPPGSVVGKFDGAVTKEQLVAKLQTAQSNPCAGGKCGPGGCGPKK
jgi:thioredoxin-like negative regulator of GroEL